MAATKFEQIPDATLKDLYEQAVVRAIFDGLMAELFAKARPIIQAAAEKAAKDLETVIRKQFDVQGDRYLMALNITVPSTESND